MLRWARRCVQTTSSWNFTCPVAFSRPRAKGNCFRAGAGSLQWTSASAVNLNPLTAGPDLAGSDSLSAPCRGGAAGGGAAAGAGPPTPITGRWLISYALLDSSPVLLELYCLYADPASRGEEAPELLPLMARFPYDDEIDRERAMSPDRAQQNRVWLPGSERGRQEDWWKTFPLQPEQPVGKPYY